MPWAKLTVLLLFFLQYFFLLSFSLSPALGQSRAATGFSRSHGDRRDGAAMATMDRLLERRATSSLSLHFFLHSSSHLKDSNLNQTFFLLSLMLFFPPTAFLFSSYTPVYLCSSTS